MSAPEITTAAIGPATNPVSDAAGPDRVPTGHSTRMMIGGEAQGSTANHQRAASARKPLLEVAG